jgi:hypothetical protein
MRTPPVAGRATCRREQETAFRRAFEGREQAVAAFRRERQEAVAGRATFRREQAPLSPAGREPLRREPLRREPLRREQEGAAFRREQAPLRRPPPEDGASDFRGANSDSDSDSDSDSHSH